MIPASFPVVHGDFGCRTRFQASSGNSDSANWLGCEAVVIRDWWISIRFVCFVPHIFTIFLILVTCKNKATSASLLRQKIHSQSRFPSLFLSSLESIMTAVKTPVKNEFAFFHIKSRLFGPAQYAKCRRLFLQLNS